ncbi:MAG: YdeI/OmpD-associated family protein [Vicinamibacterales bacterium]
MRDPEPWSNGLDRSKLDHYRAFERLAPSHRRQYIGWIDSAKRAETRARRLKEAIRLLAAGKPLGLK